MSDLTFFRGLRAWWREGVARHGLRRTAQMFLTEAWDFLRESTPSRQRQRFGDIEYDLDHRFDTTSARLPVRTRLRGLVTSPYQPTDPALFHEIMRELALEWPQFTFVDIGSGKGRTLLMAAEYGFRRIIGVEILPELHQVALANIAASGFSNVESVCVDGRDFEFPPEPLVVYLFNPLPAAALSQAMSNLQQSLKQQPRPVKIIYHNPVSEDVLSSALFLKKSQA